MRISNSPPTTTLTIPYVSLIVDNRNRRPADEAVDRLLPAYAAGLRDGMKILVRTEGEPDNALAPFALLVEDNGKHRTIRYLPQGHKQVTVQQIHITNAQTPDGRRTLGGL